MLENTVMVVSTMDLTESMTDSMVNSKNYMVSVKDLKPMMDMMINKIVM